MDTACALDPQPASPEGADFEALLAPLAEHAAVLRPPASHERKNVLRPEAATLLDRLLVRVARGRGALDVALGQGLAALAVGDRALRLGFSGIGDYARERLGLSARTAQAMAQLARALESRPLLREAVRRGDVSARKALAILRVAQGDCERFWVARARVQTVRALEVAVAAALRPGNGATPAGGSGAPGTDETAGATGVEENEPWERIAIPIAPGDRAQLDRAMGLAGKLLGATAPPWQRVEAIAQEYLGAHPAPGDGETEAAFAHRRVAGWVAEVKELFERQTEGWSFFETAAAVAAPPSPSGADDLRQLDAELRRLARLRDRWDGVLGHLAMLFRLLGLWRDAKFVSFAHYCAERLGMGERTVAQRAALERRLYDLPQLRRALAEGEVSYEKARLVAQVAREHTSAGWIAKARRLTCIALRREVESQEGTQMCARGEVGYRTPRRVALLLEGAVRAVRTAAAGPLTVGRCLGVLAGHFIETWGRDLKQRATPHRRVLARDGGWCQVPGCSRAGGHAHHIVPRSAGGSDEPHNLVSLCAAHHLHGVHAGYIRVRGRAPDQLTWTLGVALG